jgi:hypothetical protein
MATFTVVLDNSPLGSTNSGGYNAFIDAYGNGTNDTLNVYVTPSYNGDLSNYADIWADSGDTINFFFDPAYRPIADANVSANDAYVTITGTSTHYIELNDGVIDGGVFTGTITFAVGIPPDYVVEGTTGDDVIDASYLDDPEGDQVDAGDALSGGDEDSIVGGGGNDTIYGGAADDTIEGDGTLPSGGSSVDGNDVVFGGGGDDSISGGGGDDVLYGDGDGPGLIGDGSFDMDYGSSNNTINNLPTQIAGLFNGNSSTTVDYRDAASRVGTPEDIVDPTDDGGYIRMISFQTSRELLGIDMGQTLLAGETYTITFDGALGATNSGSFLGEGNGAFEFYGSSVEGQTGGGYGLPANAVSIGNVSITTADVDGDGDSRTFDTYTLTFTPTVDIESLYVRGDYNGSTTTPEYYFIDNIGVTHDSAPPPAPGNDTIDGGDGADIIDGQEGDDSLTGGTGNDTFVASSGADIIDGGADTDTYTAIDTTTLSDPNLTVNVDDIGDGSAVVSGGMTSDVLTSVENYIADETTGNDEITLTTTVTDVSTIVGLDDNSVGTFTPADGGPVINFGPSDALQLSDVLAITDVRGTFQITSGDETGQIGNISFENFETINFDVAPVCFARGTMILTPNGDVPIEDLRVGSRVETLDHGPQTIRWIGSTKRAATGACAPVHIRTGALDNDRDLWVSQQHRMVLRGARAELLFGEHEVLVPAKSLVNDCSIRIVEGGVVEYFHILFDNHEIIYAEGAMAESLHLGKQSFDALSHVSMREIEMLFPELAENRSNVPVTARQVLRHYEVKALLRAV